jgi:type I restriction enzyme S subunit
MNELPIPLAPRAEQDAIVAAIEEEFARIDAIESEFDAVDRLEAQLRNALYRDAFRGRPSRAMDELSAEGPWPTSPLSGVATVLRGVTFKKGEASDTPGDGLVPVLRSGNVQESLVTDSRLLFLPMSAIKTEQMLSQGDLVVSVSNSLELVGKSAPLVDTWQGSFGAFLSVVRPGPQLRPGFLAHYARSSSWRSSVAEVATATSNIANINLSKLKALQIPLPSLGMQDHVVEAIEAELPRLAHVRDLTAGGRLDLDRLRQSILHRAFAGALLPSNPDASPESPTVTAP